MARKVLTGLDVDGTLSTNSAVIEEHLNIPETEPANPEEGNIWLDVNADPVQVVELDELTSGQRIGGFVGVTTSTVSLTTVNQTADVPPVSVTFTKGSRPIKCEVFVAAIYHSLTTRPPSIEIWDQSDNVIWGRQVLIPTANFPITVEFNFEPKVQPAEGVHTWRMVARQSGIATPGTMTVSSGTDAQLRVYNG